MSSGYPAHREADVVLHDGSTVRLRPVRGEDREALRRFYEGLSIESRAFRFFSGAVDLERAAATFADVDYAERYGLVATRGGELVGHGLYVGGPDGRAEVAFAVAEEMQGRGLGRSCSPTSPRSPPSMATSPSSPACYRRTTG